MNDHLQQAKTSDLNSKIDESVPRVKVEAVDSLRSQDDIHEVHLEPSQCLDDHIPAFEVKMELQSEEKDENVEEKKSAENKVIINSLADTEKFAQNTKKMKIAISSGKVDEFIKEGKLERLPNGTFRVMEDVLKEIESCSIGNKVDLAKGNFVSSCNVQESQAPPVVLKRKRGRPRKGTFIPRTVQREDTTINEDNQIQVTAAGRRILSINSKIEDATCDSTEAGDVETDGEIKPKRRRRSKVLDDYVADFNTSDEEVEINNRIPKFNGRGRGRGRGTRKASSELHDSELFSSYVGIFSKKFTLQDDFADDDAINVKSESDDEEFNNSESPSVVKILNISEEGIGPNSGIEMCIGPEGKTKLQIVDTGETSITNGEENLVYHVIATTGESSTVIPFTVPKGVNNDETEKSDIPSTSQAEKVELENIVQGTSRKINLSRSQRIQSKRMVRTYNQKITALRQQYLRAVQELRKRKLYTLADLVCGASRFLTEEQLVFFTLQLKSGCHNVQGVRYSVREKILALAFYLQSPALYKWLRAIFHLPTKLILERWLEGIAKSDTDSAKRLMYHIYTKYIFKANT